MWGEIVREQVLNVIINITVELFDDFLNRLAYFNIFIQNLNI